MSYEGNEEFKCKECGHQDSYDVYGPRENSCTVCGGKYHLTRSVDYTNAEPVYGKWRDI